MFNTKTRGKPVVLITGKNGQVGWELQRTMAHIGRVVACGSQDLDLSDPDKIVSLLRDIKPNIIINPAAYTAVDKAEQEVDLAMKINGVAPGILGEEAARLGAFMIHYSTDYVFNGRKETPYTEEDVPDPISVYGATKLHGDNAVQASGVKHMIFRTSWVYAARGHNFLNSMLKLGRQREELRIVSDQTGSPTWARTIAEVSLHALINAGNGLQDGSFESGLFNLVPSGDTSWHGFAERIFEIAKSRLGRNDLLVNQLVPIPSSEFPTAAKRPLNSRLDTHKLEGLLGSRLPEWDKFVELCMLDL